jgi:thiamine biosynthesis lipoprotein
MKKLTSVYILLLAFCLCGCQSNTVNTDTQFVLDTVAKLTADCSSETLNSAFELCRDYEKLLSRTKKESAVYKLNNSNGFIETDAETLKIIERSIYFSKLSDGKFDITILPVSSLWDFNNQIVPPKDEIAEALKNIDYEAIEIVGEEINLNGKKIDLGSIAKGYIADKTKDFLLKNGATEGIVNLGGNVVIFGKEYKIGIQKPFSDSIAANLYLKDKSVVTSGIYQRYIETDDRLYHHIIDPETGYGVENELASVTVIGNSSMDCDALSTVCMLVGTEKATEIINSITDTEAVFIDKNGKLTYTDGLVMKKDNIYLK